MISISVLEPLLKKYLADRTDHEVCFLWTANRKKFRNLKFQFVDVVLFGDGPYYLSDASLWRRDCQYRFWVLCHSGKALLNRLFGIPESSIHVIDRYELFPSVAPLYSIESGDAFVYAGRRVPEKNVELLVEVLRQLQRTPPFEDYRIYFCGQRSKGLKNKQIQQGPWRTPPEFRGDLGTRWAEAVKGKPIFINLSTYRFEDFNVAAAQAQARGWPTIVTNWYGLRDVRGSQSIHVSAPKRDVLNSELWGAAAERISAEILQGCRSGKIQSPSGSRFSQEKKSEQPQFIKGSEVQALIRSCSKQDLLRANLYFLNSDYRSLNAFSKIEDILSESNS